ncbi:DUF2339 domain-containing protein [Thermodesulfobacteriota bacterium]
MMIFLLWILVILLFIILVIINSRLKGRIDSLEKIVSRLENVLDRKGPPDAFRAEEPQPETAAPGQKMEAKIPSFTYTESHTTKEDQTPTLEQQVEPSEQDIRIEHETLEDLILPDGEDETQPAPPFDRLDESGTIPLKQPSQWSEQWKAFKSTVDWEQFTGVKLFAWLGGLALFIAAGFFVKFSIDRNLIPPALRLAVSALIGIGLIIGANRFSVQKFSVMRHTLSAAGIGVLYGVVFAATLYYEYLTKPMGFGLLAVVSAAAFVLAVYHKSIAVSVLGAVGAYATPVLVSTGQGSLVMLFGYLVVVNLGLYQVARRLVSQGLLLVAAFGTAATLGLGTWHTFWKIDGIIIAVTWILNLTLFVLFLGYSNVDPKENQSTHWTGILTFLSALAVAITLLLKPGWPCLLLVTAALAAAIGLAWRHRGWHGFVIPYAALGFLVALVWVLVRFEPTQFSAGFLLLLLYGIFGGLGPLVLVWRYGLNRKMLFWFRVFPLAIVFISIAVLFQQPVVSFWFWPLLLGLELIGIGISLLFRAFIQVGLLVLFFVIGALNWLFHVPGNMLGIGFFLFIICAGIILCAGLFLLIKRLPDVISLLQLDREGADHEIPVSDMPNVSQWLAAAPAAGVCVLLAASFMIDYPHYPHPGMLTLICFLALVLIAVRRLGFEISGVAALLGTAAAQAVFVLNPVLGPPAYFSTIVWSGALFLIGLLTPFLFFRSIDRWQRIWNGWALFEAAQAVFILYATQGLWPEYQAQWVPLVLALFKLPVVALLLRRLKGRPERNAILAFHGGVLLFYLSTLPVLVLDHGWIGLTFVFEAFALLWLNRRIEHPGLRWVALAMAPLGLVILAINLPLLKTTDSLALINSATLCVAAAVLALALAVSQAGYPQRRLKNIDLPNYFMWLTVATGFFLINLVVADLFAQPGTRFTVWPGQNFAQWACYALSWVALGGLLRRLTRLPDTARITGLWLVAAGALGMILLPLVLPQAAAHMRPLFNSGLALYLPLLAALYFLFHKEKRNEDISLVKNILLALFLGAGFITLKLQSGTLFATGYPFSLLMSKTPAKAAASAAGWLIYGLGLLIWPKRLDRPFRMAGLVLIIVGLLKAMILPFSFRVAFAQMTPLLNPPSFVYLFCLAALIYLTMRKWDQRWPMLMVVPRVFWGVVLAIFTFVVLNIEIASVFAIKGRPFSMMTHGSLAMQLAYSIGWLLFAIGLLVVGIRWNVVKVRWAAILAIVATACKIFILDVRSLGQLYRVGSLLGLAVVLILVSFLYQRFLSEGKKDEQ